MGLLGWLGSSRRASPEVQLALFSSSGVRPDGKPWLLPVWTGRDATRCAMLGWALPDGALEPRPQGSAAQAPG